MYTIDVVMANIAATIIVAVPEKILSNNAAIKMKTADKIYKGFDP